MKIATITCHDVYNYGASLQAYALQEYYSRLGHDYQIIDYIPPHETTNYSLSIVNNPRFDKPLIRQLYLFAKFPGRLRDLKRKHLFDKFTSKYLRLSDRRFYSCQEMANESPKADLYIAGSDQIWNTLFPNGRDAAFYLDFAPKGSRKISYAASFATDKIYNNAEAFVKEKLGNFDAISVRETSALTLLSELGYSGTYVCDPVFLLDAASWLNLIKNKPTPRKDYICVYDCEKSAKLRIIAENLRQQTGLPIYSVSPTSGRYANKYFSNSGPLEFLALIANARYVLANSFHALAFSLIFKKDFYIINRTQGINARMRDFLSYLGLSDRLIDAPTEVSSEHVDFSNAESKLNSLIKESKAYINTQTHQDTAMQ